MRKNFRKIRTTAIALIIVCIILIAFVGIYAKQLNAYTNLLPNYTYGMDLYGKRQLVFKPSTASSDKLVYVDSDGNILGEVPTNDSNEQGTSLDSETALPEAVDTTEKKINYAQETRTIKDNDDAVLTKEGFEQSKKVIEKRLEARGIQEYNVRLDEVNGDIVLEVIDSADFDQLYDLVQTKGAFTAVDSQTGLVLMSPDMLKKASAVYNTSDSGYQAYLQIEFTKEGAEKLKEMSKEYVQVTLDDGSSKTYYVELKVDGNLMMKTYFGEELDNGTIQIKYGEATTDIDAFTKSYNNVSALATVLNSGITQVKYEMSTDNFVKANISTPLRVVAYSILYAALICVTVYFAIVYKPRNGILAGLANIGFAALVTIVIRYTNVIVTYNSIIAYAMMIALNVIFTNMFLKLVQEQGTGEEAFLDTVKVYYKAVIPVIILSVVFTFVLNVSIASVGMVVFWSLFLQFVYNGLIMRTMFIGLDKSNDDSLERKIEENKKQKKKQAKANKVNKKGAGK